MMKKKKTYTIQELDELKEWFEANIDRTPDEMQISSCAYARDLKETIQMLFEQSYICYENPRMQGCILLLEQIKRKIEER